MSRLGTAMLRRRNRSSGLGAVGSARIERRGALVVGEGLQILNEPIRSHIVVDSGARLSIGSNLRMAHGCGIYCGARSTIGSNVVMQAFVSVIDSDFHVAGNLAARPEPRSIHIGDDVVLGSWTVVLPGSVIADGAVVAAGSVVSGRVAAGAHVSGNPARPTLRGADRDQISPGDDVNARVVRLLSELFDHQVDLTMSRDQIVAWDSLGSVRLLGALEEAFPAFVIVDKLVLAACSVEDVVNSIKSVDPVG
ncbi:MAG: hypothetical protein ABI658_19500 [Acidimicrobiales bacterium]